MVTRHGGEQVRIVGQILVSHVEAKQPQPSCELSEMAVSDERADLPDLQPRFGAQSNRRRNRIDVDFGIFLECVGKSRWLAVNENQIDLGMWHPERFDHV